LKTPQISREVADPPVLPFMRKTSDTLNRLQEQQPVSALVAAIAAEVVRQIEPKLARITPNVVQPALLDVKQAGTYVGRSEQAIQHLIFERQIPVVRSGRRVHLRRSDLEPGGKQN
jgi:hypothetical protein